MARKVGDTYWTLTLYFKRNETSVSFDRESDLRLAADKIVDAWQVHDMVTIFHHEHGGIKLVLRTDKLLSFETKEEIEEGTWRQQQLEIEAAKEARKAQQEKPETVVG